MNLRLLAFLAILGTLILAGCSFRGEADDDDDSDGVTVTGDGDDEDNDAPAPGLVMVLGTVGLAVLSRRRFLS